MTNGTPTILGTENDDDITGTENAENINALGGNDVVNGACGSDVIDGGPGDDVLSATAILNADVIFKNGFDQLELPELCTEGVEFITGPGDDMVNGGDGPDMVTSGGPGNKTVVTDGGNDNIDMSDATSSTVLAGSGNDVINDSDGNDFLSGNDGDDIIQIGFGTDNVGLGLGSDNIILKDTGVEGDGNDTITLGDDNDVDIISCEGTNVGFDFIFDFNRGADLIDFAPIFDRLGVTTTAEFQTWLDNNVLFDPTGPNIAVQLDGTLDNAIILIGLDTLTIDDFVTDSLSTTSIGQSKAATFIKEMSGETLEKFKANIENAKFQTATTQVLDLLPDFASNISPVSETDDAAHGLAENQATKELARSV